MEERSTDYGGSPRRRVPQQVTRLLLMFLLFGVALVVARHFLVPPTFGQVGHYRAAAAVEVAARPVKYAGREACYDCHPDVLEVHSKGRHQFVGCETCHGPAAAHTENPAEVKPRIPRERDFCPRCHNYDPSRPTGFPQIDAATHNPGKPCVSCHTPHAPSPPTLPASCAACHGEIARTKASSHHATVACTTCHQVSDAHKENPRANLPSKPSTREFCGQCHDQAADASKVAATYSGPIPAANIPRVDMTQHGRRFLCWQCHYPHSPEVR